jgi:hypothetical protein
VELCGAKLGRARQLIDGLGGEKARWGATADAMQAAFERTTGVC